MNLLPLTTKVHYQILDGLRGIAALMVVIFHLFEAHATSHQDQIINHGYLAVDFFFLLSGFVIGYAYDDRWGKMTIESFIKRRLVRLQPMVIIGMVIGAVFFYLQESSLWPSIAQTSVWKMLLFLLLGCFMIPVPPSIEIRGWGEIYPLNGPGWSLFFEYIVNLFYALGARKLSKFMLSILVLLSAGALVYLAVTQGDVIGGWSLNAEQLQVGFSRVMYPFFAGLLLFRMSQPAKIKNAFFWCSLLLILVLALPRIGTAEQLWKNGLYDALNIIITFPLIIFLGAGGEITNGFAKKLCKFLGDISYPIYITHYPLIYTYTAWVYDKKISLQQGFPIAILVFISSIAIAYACLKLYDEPVRTWLQKKVFLQKKQKPQ